MAWYDEAVFYHIYPLGLLGAPKQNEYGEAVHRLKNLDPWIDHVLKIGVTAIYIGPLFESVGHGYETTDYKKLDSRLGTNEDLKAFVAKCHEKGIRVIFDGVFNHTGRDFFAFKDIQQNRENSRYLNWYCNVNFWGNNEYNDGFSYDNWGGYNLLVKLNQRNPEVKDYICDVIRFWVQEFDVDGIRLDAADVLDFDFMKALRATANEVKDDFWLMGEVIHGEYSRWVNEGTLHSVTNYHLHKALYSGHNDHNYFEIAHTVKRLNDMGSNQAGGMKLYNFVDNHDVERIYTKLNNKAHFLPTHVLLYTLPGIPSLYYGSEFGIEGRKYRGGSDDDIRPALNLEDFAGDGKGQACAQIVSKLGRVRQNVKALSYGNYQELTLTTTQYAFSRNLDGNSVLITVSNSDEDAWFNLPASNAREYVGVMTGETVAVQDGRINVKVSGNCGEIWVPMTEGQNLEWLEKEIKLAKVEKAKIAKTVKKAKTVKAEEIAKETKPVEEKPVKKAEAKKQKAEDKEQKAEAKNSVKKAETKEQMMQDEILAQASEEKDFTKLEVPNKSYEEMSVLELQAVVYTKMAKNGPVTDQMKRTIEENVYHDSLVNWAKSFR